MRGLMVMGHLSWRFISYGKRLTRANPAAAMRPRAEAPCWAAPPVKIGEPVGAGADPAPVPEAEGDPVPKGMLVRCWEDGHALFAQHTRWGGSSRWGWDTSGCGWDNDGWGWCGNSGGLANGNVDGAVEVVSIWLFVGIVTFPVKEVRTND